MKRSMAILLTVLLVIGVFSGCSDRGEYVPTGDGLTWDEDYTGPVYTRPQNDGDQVLKLAYNPTASMNPYLCTDLTNRTLFSLMYQGLFIVDRTYQVEPLLCSRYTVSDDMKQYVFYIEEDARFSDGTAITVQDVVASLAAAKESPVYGGRFGHISQILLTEDGGVALQLDTPYENLPLLLDIPVVQQSQVQADRPLGSGPYVLELSGDGASLRKNEGWWCRAEMTVTAPVISLIQAESATQVRDEFEFSDLSLVCTDPGSDKYADYRCDYELWDCENNIFLFLACNMTSKVFSIPEIRAALPMAVDRDGIAEEFYRGFARSVSLPASPLSPYYSQALADKYVWDGGEALTKAVAEAQLAPDTTVSLLVNSDDSLRLRVARSVADGLRACGLTVYLKEAGGEDYLRALRLRDYDLYLGQTKLSANMDLSAFFYTTGALSYGALNDAGMYTLCLESLANHGNYYTLHQNVMNDGRLCPILFRSYAVYATRGLLTDLTPARDNVFYYSLGKTMESAKS